MEKLYGLFIKLFYVLYFKFLHLAFYLWNIPKPRKSVPPATDPLLNLSAKNAAEIIRNQEITSTTLIKAYIKRIEEVNPLINAVVIKNFKNALQEASEVDALISGLDKNSDEFKNLAESKPLLGLPFTIKDSFAIKGLVCTVGLYHRKDKMMEEDAEVVKRLKNAGAILLAVTNVPEGVMWGETANTLFGRTNNPYDLRRTSGGSSGGEAALIASSGSLFGIGSDYAGSIRGPAAFCGLYGLMPNIVPLDGSFPEVKSGYRAKMWRVGPLCRFPEDLELVLRVIAGEKSESILHLSQPVDVKNTKIFYMEGIRAPHIEEPHLEVIQALRKEKFEGWKELVKFFLGRSKHTLPGILGALEASYVTEESEKNETLYKRDALKRTLESLLSTSGVLFFPTFPTLASPHNHRLFTPPMFGVYCGLWNALGFCAINIPMGVNQDGIPLHVQIVAPAGMEWLLIKLAREFEPITA